MKPLLPPLIRTEWFEGYDYDELAKLFGPKFGEWMRGQTMAEHMVDDRAVAVVYRWDVDNYLRGGPVLD